ncbi:MAG TPA: 5-(carboxyamino)imidazole ribonucleotide synthase [Candidatus Saccharimonadales bacterium]|nr:5-(carboxyamino)imidazole ribonucleotide synthase [Candidatus Saccharimonadales bacterium]
MKQPVIGIVGGGQLGRMLALAAAPLGFKVAVLNPAPGSPAAQVGAEEIVGDLYDRKALQKLAGRADFLTVEIEHLDAAILEEIAASGTPVNPAPATVRMIQDKLRQKEFLEAAGVPVAPFQEIADEAAALEALEAFGGRMLIKTRHGAYDGRGNMAVKSPVDVTEAFKVFTGKQLYAERFIPFEKELAVMIVRDVKGNTAVYPVAETVHERNICLEVTAPAPVSDKHRQEAGRIARKVAGLLDGAGAFGIEMFLTKDGMVLVNEIAPRVHNSGHYTMDACRTSQFEQHIRAIAGLPLGPTELVVPAAAMVNILGERNGPTEVKGLGKALSTPYTNVHIYGKSPTKIDRKMGHVNATGDNVEEALKRARSARKALDI